MNYKESRLILEKIKKSKRILLNCHRGPDPDSIGSVLALYSVLKRLHKEVEIICPSNEVLGAMSFLENYNAIKFPVDFTKFDFSRFDLFIILDSSNWDMVTGAKGFKPPKLPVIVIDHHLSNKGFGTINLVDSKSTSAAELLYRVFKDWKLNVDKPIADSLLTGIISDTGCFQYPGVDGETLKISGELIANGADKDGIIHHLFRNVDFKEVKLWGEFIKRMVLEKDYGFVWTAIPLNVFEKYGKIPNAKEDVAHLVSQVVKGTEFGITMLETSKGLLSVSLRSRNSFDVSKIASEIGGGGHKSASGARIEGLSFERAVEKVLKAARKHAKKSIKKFEEE